MIYIYIQSAQKHRLSESLVLAASKRWQALQRLQRLRGESTALAAPDEIRRGLYICGLSQTQQTQAPTKTVTNDMEMDKSSVVDNSPTETH